MLLNQEARNKAVVETYLRGIDPDTGERYLGQNAMVFATATKHADSMVSQFNNALTEGDGIKIVEWLDQEGLELIAAVHGKSEGQFLRPGLFPNQNTETRQFSNGKEFYTEEEIFDLHERGKILILVSVAKLKWGFDSPRDSLLFDLADRFSKVDATQIDGRAFRLDPNTPNKTATVFNLMDENTQELYDKYPKLIPIYCAEVIEGAEFRPPAKRSKATISYRRSPPGLIKSLEESGFSVITDIDAVQTISCQNKAKRDRALIDKRETLYEISEEDLASLEEKIEHTGLGPKSIVNELGAECPKGLRDHIIENWRNRDTTSADPDHWAAVLKVLEHALGQYKKITDDERLNLVKQLDKKRVGSRLLIKSLGNKIEDLTEGMIRAWIEGKTKYVWGCTR